MAPKKQKPKIETEREVSDELAAIAGTLISEFCPGLREARIEYVMVTRINEVGNPVDPRVQEKMGQVRKAGIMDRILHGWDFIVTISGNWWAKLSDHDKRALLYHQLCHCWMNAGKPQLQKHEFEGFFSELRHFGAWENALAEARSVLLQGTLDFAGESEAEVVQQPLAGVGSG